jgi:hypothetical protein
MMCDHRYIGRMALKMQFSLRLIFVVTAAVAVLLGEAVAFPDWIAEIVGLVVSSLLPPAVVAGIVYAHENRRAFCLGTLVWWLSARWMLLVPGVGSDFQLLDGGRIDYCIWWSLGFTGGLVAVVVRWLTLSKVALRQGKSGDESPHSKPLTTDN